MRLFEIYNPTNHRRVIFDGSREQAKVVIEPEMTVKARLYDTIADCYGDGSDKNRDDLWVKPLTESKDSVGGQPSLPVDQKQQHKKTTA